MKNSDHTGEKMEKKEPEFKIGIPLILFGLLGFIIAWINMIIILESMQVWSYLSIIFTTSVPGILISLKNRYWGYSYMGGFSASGIPFSIIVDLFIGGYTFFTSIFIFVIMWLIFWKTWRSLSKLSMKGERTEIGN